MHDHALAPADFEFIEDILLKYGDDNSVLNLAELDGYFTALVSGRRRWTLPSGSRPSGVGRSRPGKARKNSGSLSTCARAISTALPCSWPA
ncbi:hypothetical protein ACNQUA_11855, partial [Corynebacterium diphtheriae]